MKRHFYFFRHGQTNENKVGATYGNRVEAYLTPDGNYMINPSGIRGRVSEIVKQMEMDLIKQRATIQHE